MEDVQAASQRIVATSEWAMLALLAVAGVSIIALAVAMVALERTTYER